MTAGTRTRLAWSACGVLLALIAGCGRGTAPSAAPSRSPGSPAAASDRPAEGAIADIKLDLLKNGSAATAAPGRDPFRFVIKAAPPPRPAAPAEPPRPVVVAPPAPTGPPPPPPILLKFIGVLEAARSGKVAILSDGRGNVSYGKEGDIIEGRYQVVRIGAESIDLAYADGRGRQTIRLSGQ